MIARLIEFIVFALILLGMFLIVRKAWKRADMQETARDKLEKIANEKELASVINIDAKEVRANRKKISDFENL